MKKWLSGFIGLVLLSLVLMACSGGSESSGGESDVDIPEGATEVVMWNLFAGGDAEYMQNIVDAFNESQSEYFVNNIMQENAEYYTKLLTSIGAGKGPDLAIAHTHVLPELVSQGLVQDLDSIGEEVGVKWDEFNQNILDATIYEDKHYAVPMDTHAQIMYINNKLVAEAGLLNEDGTLKMEKTPEGYVEFYQTLRDTLPEDKIPFAFSSSGSDPYWTWWTFYSQMGGRGILTEDSLENPKYDLDVDNAVKAAFFVNSLYHDNEIIPLNISDFYSEFQSENAATMNTGVWATGTWESTDGLEFTPMPIPTIFGEDAAWGSSHTFVLPYYQKADEAAQKGAVEFMNFAADHGAMWAQAGHIPSKTTVVESEEFQELPYRSEYAEVASYVNFVDRNIYARGLEEIVIRHLDTIWSGEATPEEAFAAMETEVKDLIGE
ncbi:extracellular solute-binding protein [Gracilibacillus salinarum]|uniref:Extracellular solute-binding protein n=1 Tax=Gracilibacillus salinarum TaxID=2932255 RepID=A0ABY4GUD6_9BACI|nr:extracellular solute-binding protein [Gracilibacillus salinarum]UOQ86812.1 extracellular solute-binding protein [Gracilibacillus salinarum]